MTISNSDPEITFILGVPRSGTTLVRVLLDSHTQVTAGPETGWLTGGYTDSSLRQLVELLTHSKLGIVDNYVGISGDNVTAAARDFVIQMMASHLEAVGKPRLVLKTPNDIAFLDFLSDLFPEAKYIHICRDGRDVAFSTVAKKGEFFSDSTLGEFGELTFLNALQRWHVWESEARKTEVKKGLSVVHLSYEDLVCNPEGELRRICDFMDVAYEVSMLEYATFEHRYPTWEAGSKDVRERKSIVDASVGRWKTDINLLEASSIPNETERYLIELDYEPTNSVLDDDFLDTVRAEAELRKTSIDDLQLELNNLRANLDERESADQRSAEEFRVIHDGLSGLGTRLEELLDRLQSSSELTEELDRLFKENAELRESISKSQQEATSLKAEKEQYHLDLNQSKVSFDEKVHELESKLRESLSRQFESEEAAKTQLASLEAQKVEFKNLFETRSLQSQMIQDSLKSVIAEQEKGLREKEAVIQNILQSRSWKVARAAIVPLGFFRNVLKGKELQDTVVGDVNRTIQSAEDSNRHELRPVDTKKPQGSSTSSGRVNLGNQIEEYFGAHRSGWSYAVQSLERLHDEDAIFLDTFIERTFAWPGHREPILRPWVGVLHVPPTGPDWFLGEQSNDAVFNSELWKASLPFCRGLFCLSSYHKRHLEKRLELPVDNLIHPTETPDELWDPKRFRENRNRKVVQLGWWLRVLHSIYELPDVGYEKVFLRARADQAFQLSLARERELHLKLGLFELPMEKSVTHVDFLENSEYDRLLTENVAFIHLYDASANNAVIECIVRNTPLLVNPIPPVIEYLGTGYPLYFSSLDEAASKLSNTALILQAHEYLKEHPIKQKLTGSYFAMSVEASRLVNEK
jgi:sulfotransferase family protein